jgi:hypothetical protein
MAILEIAQEKSSTEVHVNQCAMKGMNYAVPSHVSQAT